MHLRNYLMQQYEKQGWIVSTEFSEGKNTVFEGWTGIYPDILGVKGSKRLAICIETESTLRGEYASVKWKSILRNAGASLLVVVRDGQSRDLAVKIAERNGIELDCRIMRRRTTKKRKGLGLGPLFKNRMSLFVMMITIVIVFIVSFLFLPALRKQGELQSDYYRPFDSERQVDTINKETNKLQK